MNNRACDCENESGGAEWHPPARRREIRDAIRLEAVTLAWMVVEALGSVGAGLAARSLLLVAFGFDSVIELLSAIVVFRRLRHEAKAKAGDAAWQEAHERRASRLAGYLLYGLSAYVVIQALYGLASHHGAETSVLGIAIGVIAAIGMPILARAKRRLADRLGSRALRADAMESLTCGYLSWAVLGGLLVNALFQIWWIDSVASLAIVPLLLREAKEAVRGECCAA